MMTRIGVSTMDGHTYYSTYTEMEPDLRALVEKKLEDISITNKFSLKSDGVERHFRCDNIVCVWLDDRG